MTAVARTGVPVRLAFFLVPQFSMMSFSAALEPLRAANRLSGAPLYEWQLVSVDGKAVVASNGIPIDVHLKLDQLRAVDVVVVCVGLEPMQLRGDRRVRMCLRALAQRGCQIGGISGGSFVLAQAGLLDGRRCTVHWEYAEQFRGRYAKPKLCDDLYVVDDKVFTCAGGTAALDMMLHFVSAKSGPDLAHAVAEQFMHARIRDHDDRQRMDLHVRYGVSSPILVDAIRIMLENLSDPVGLPVIAKQVGISGRQLERLFRRHVGMEPRLFYLQQRLTRSRGLLLNTMSPIRSIALECGFGSTSYFCHAYKRVYLRTPTEERRLLRHVI